MNISSNKLVPHVIAVVLFLVLSFVYFIPMIQGKQLSQHDVNTYKGMSKEIVDFKKETGEHTLWTNSMFGGMPSYLIQNYVPNNYIKYLDRAFKLFDKARPASFLFMYFFGFYLFMLLFGFNPWQSIIGALAYGLSAYFLIIIQAGHITKVIALGYMPPIIGGVYAAYRGKRLLGALTTALFTGMQLLNNHLQITYYTIMIIVPLVVIFFIDAIKKKEMGEFVKSSLYLFVGLILAVGVNFQSLAVTYEYGKYSIRGKSELSHDKENRTTGLDRDYATAWSYGKLETFNMLIPNLMGGSSDSELSENSEAYKKLRDFGYPKSQALKTIKHMPTYWGPQPMTSGPVYVGALIVFLFVLGIFLVKGSVRTWVLIVTALAVMLAWGRNFMWFTDLFFDYLPGYNKFRTVSMTLVMAQFVMPLLGLLAVKNIVDGKVSKDEILKALKYATGIVGGIIIFFLINPGILSFTSPGDAQLGDFASALIADRESMMRSDAIRSLMFVLIGSGSLWLYVNRKIKSSHLYLILGLAILVDLWGVDKRYMNNDDFVSKRKAIMPFTPSAADKFILQDITYYRVLNVAVSTFNDASTSYFHKSIGGYHGAKMRRYQELIDFEINKEIQQFINTLKSKPTPQAVDSTLRQLNVLNMLNTKYIIYNPQAQPVVNPYALGNAWFVDKVKVVENADEEIKAVQNFNPSKLAIADKRFKDQLFDFSRDSSAVISLTEYRPNYLKYSSKAATDQLAVMSEIYYDKGWNAYVDGKPVPHFRVDYVLRAMKVPAGEHTIEFKFEPETWKIGGVVSLVSSILFFLFIIIVFYTEYKKKGDKTQEVN
ncbi:MAG: YfhO family protein [Chlorobi bacterium]|nr:YfhO family protein [Chlorobiota bacterium]